MESWCGSGKMRILKAERFHSFMHLVILQIVLINYSAVHDKTSSALMELEI